MDEKLKAIAEEQNLAAWDGSRIRALIELIVKYAPMILPYILPLFGMKSADDEGLKAAPEREMTALDWKAIIMLILQILTQLFPPTPTPTPTPDPVPTPGPIA
jgi:hypothetical protein